MSTLNIGCGNRPLANAVNQDRTRHSTHVDQAFDLEEFPWPLPNDSFEQVVARDVLEHIRPDHFYGVMDEIHRICQEAGRLHVQVPQAGSLNAIIDPTHWRGFHLKSFDFLDPRTRLGRASWTTDRRWALLKAEQIRGSDVNLSFVLEPIK